VDEGCFLGCIFEPKNENDLILGFAQNENDLIGGYFILNTSHFLVKNLDLTKMWDQQKT